MYSSKEKVIKNIVECMNLYCQSIHSLDNKEGEKEQKEEAEKKRTSVGEETITGKKRKERENEESVENKKQKLEDFSSETTKKVLEELFMFDSHNWSREAEFDRKGEWNLEFRVKRILETDRKFHKVEFDKPIPSSIMEEFQSKWKEMKKK